MSSHEHILLAVARGSAPIERPETTESTGDTRSSSLVPPRRINPVQEDTSLADQIWFFATLVLYALIFVVIGYLLLKLVRLGYEIWASRRLVFMSVTLPRADSKLDKEKETKKDFKEKMGIMGIFYKGIQKMSEATIWETIMDFIFDHSKVSMELVYDEGRVSFFVTTYPEYASLIQQQVTANYPDAEVKMMREFPIDLKPRGYTLRAASIGKENADELPIRTYKYLEDDPLSTFTNNF